MIARPRFLALTEFGPRSLIYHEGGIYRVIKVKLSANALNHVAADGHLMKTKGYICSHCGCGMFNDDKASEPPMYSVFETAAPGSTLKIAFGCVIARSA